MPAGTEVLDARFAALADPTRRAILARLSRGEAANPQKGTDETGDAFHYAQRVQVGNAAGTARGG
jgi:DNA-binding transcriptional ArsR family regulator